MCMGIGLYYSFYVRGWFYFFLCLIGTVRRRSDYVDFRSISFVKKKTNLFLYVTFENRKCNKLRVLLEYTIDENHRGKMGTSLTSSSFNSNGTSFSSQFLTTSGFGY